MYNSIPDYFRRISVENLFNISTVRKCWPTWQRKIMEILGPLFDESDILNLGDHLSEVFGTTGEGSRDQSSLSVGGTAWEALVCYYLNLCSAGSRVVAFRRMSLVPKPIRNAITVNYSNYACNTESDITVVVFPNKDLYNNNLYEISDIIETPRRITFRLQNNKINPEIIDYFCQQDFEEFEIGIIQCKTNWNDNAQIPMLWDMIYLANGFRGRNITIGRDGFNINHAKNFTYSFVTVPSNRRAIYTSQSVAVRRVANLSGGNYWGKPTEESVARSIKEIFVNNFQNGARTNIRQDLRNAIPYLARSLSYFRLT